MSKRIYWSQRNPLTVGKQRSPDKYPIGHIFEVPDDAHITVGPMVPFHKHNQLGAALRVYRSKKDKELLLLVSAEGSFRNVDDVRVYVVYDLQSETTQKLLNEGPRTEHVETWTAHDGVTATRYVTKLEGWQAAADEEVF